ncbi:MAG: 4Fe-4S dicluster domain-containing protein [Chloroflexota bacterium]|nr:4Fe-4S dicluster domain-containing protein [Chloroflexota bacterium]
MAKEFAVTVDQRDCITCGICMDVCPIRTLDMTRARAAGPEATFLRGTRTATVARDWMMAVPVQVAHCNGCTICVRECPTQAISIKSVPEPPAMAPRQGPILVEPRDLHGHWAPLSSYTRAAMKVQEPREAHDPWGKDIRWRIAKRVGPWQVWRTWTTKPSKGDAK